MSSEVDEKKPPNGDGITSELVIRGRGKSGGERERERASEPETEPNQKAMYTRRGKCNDIMSTGRDR